MKKIVFLQYRLFHYRQDLFNRLRTMGAQRGLQIEVVCGQPFGDEKLKNDVGHLDWAHEVRNKYFPIVEKKDLCWQPLPAHLQDADLLIFMQENRLLSNYWWMLRRKVGAGPRVAFWGHGRDFQTRAPGGFREKWKAASIKWVDWWFAYTTVTVDVVVKEGFPRERITCVNNAIDVSAMRQQWESATSEERAAVMAAVGIGEGNLVGLMCGSLYPDKKLELLFAACDLVHTRVPEFRLVIIGDGIQRDLVQNEVSKRPWAKWVGAKRGRDKALFFGCAHIVLNPGLVGLHVLDAFALSKPMITTKGALHSPEIAYLEDGRNGLMLGDSVEAYAEGVAKILANPVRLKQMQEAAGRSAELYTVDAMARKFVDGIESALAETPR